jgi:hypothetical protein
VQLDVVLPAVPPVLAGPLARLQQPATERTMRIVTNQRMRKA